MGIFFFCFLNQYVLSIFPSPRYDFLRRRRLQQQRRQQDDRPQFPKSKICAIFKLTINF